jgi:energy-coupling factor transporter ATP-binding protein EcfA2
MELRQPSKNLWLTVLGYVCLREQIAATKECTMDALGDPSKWSTLPFPSLFHQLPLDRFRLDPKRNFPFMGREIFAEVYKVVSNMSWRTGTIYSLQGTLGSGKSHILAALACLLLKDGKRVVYLPEARVMAEAMVAYTRGALLLTYADNQGLFQQIEGLSSTADICNFALQLSNRGEVIYFICDQMNGLDHFPDGADTKGRDIKEKAHSFFKQLHASHNFIWSASGNCRAKISHNARPRSGAKHLLFRQGYNKVCSSRFFVIMLDSF